MEIVEVLYIVLIFFTTIVWSLLSIVLYKILKVLNVVMEVVDIYNRVKQVMWIYSQIPDMILDKVKEFVFGKN